MHEKGLRRASGFNRKGIQMRCAALTYSPTLVIGLLLVIIKQRSCACVYSGKVPCCSAYNQFCVHLSLVTVENWCDRYFSFLTSSLWWNPPHIDIKQLILSYSWYLKGDKFREKGSTNGKKINKIIFASECRARSTRLVNIRTMNCEDDPGPGTTFDLTEMLRPKLDESRAILAEVRNLNLKSPI